MKSNDNFWLLLFFSFIKNKVYLMRSHQNGMFSSYIMEERDMKEEIGEEEKNLKKSIFNERRWNFTSQLKSLCPKWNRQIELCGFYSLNFLCDSGASRACTSCLVCPKWGGKHTHT